jgi:deazaflavin-dependent oxidoreductase (nitroreductase family)
MKMQLHHPQGWQRLIQQFAALPPVSWVYSYILHHIDSVLMWLSGGRLTVPGVLAGLSVVMLTTRGARSGQPRAVPVIAIPDGDKFVLIASHWGRKRHPVWYYNLRANPELRSPLRAARERTSSAKPPATSASPIGRKGSRFMRDTPLTRFARPIGKFRCWC